MKKAIVLAGTFPHRHLIRRLKERGYHVILIDYYENPIAKDVADEHLQVSTLDKDAVLNVARDRNVDLVITTCVDQANVTACYVAERLNLPHPYSYEASLNVTDKTAMKRIMMENGIPTSKYYIIDKIEDFEPSRLTYPIIVKPRDSNSSKGVRRIDANDEKTLLYLREALEISRSGGALIEEFKEGREVGVDCFLKNHEAHIIMTKERQKILHGTGSLQQIYGSQWPARLTPFQLAEFKVIAEKIGKAFHIDNCPLMMQAIVTDSDIYVIEFGARIGGGESYRIIGEMTGFDYIDQSINSFLGETIDLDRHASKEVLRDNYIYTTGGRFGELWIDDSVKDDVLYADAYRKYGAEVGSGISSNNRVGVFIVKGRDPREVENKVRHVVENMEVYDIDGNPMMRRDIY